MRATLQIRGLLALGVAAGALAASAGTALAGGFAVREQSTSLLGSAFAGSAAGVDLSSAFWNPAAFGTAGDGLNTQSSYSLILPSSELKNGSTSPVPVGGATSTNIDETAFLSGFYGAYRINDKLVLGLTANAPFGLATDPDNNDWVGRFHGLEASIFSFNVAPTVAYEIAPGVQVAVGLQLEYLKLKLWFPGAGDFKTSLKADDTVGVGATAGILLTPAQGTKIGIGYRSTISHSLDGDLNTPVGKSPISADLDTPDMVTASFSQAVMQGVRLLGTVEWTNWSRLDQVPVQGTPFVIDAHWDDGWFFSGGFEYDYSSQITLRAGGAYEISPVRDATQRLTQVPDSDRVWLSLGASYRYSEVTTFDVGYAHVFFDDAHIHRAALGNPGLILDADVEQDANIFSVGMRTHW